eukprot:CAMPEP_0198473276 /NCGR_PEP_ID=MMETSP1456-20131121/34063_1 /TAXON_ID=1461544 ORGANISM="Unidentified sp., Strain RCC1871" /NCGR_SAMPLE_ID=MMETSP1456 /ASSEMBLY_ACC=CAM_ASM_001119 /LENGTH=60 /DNA_ID=CAMNT_0044199931 /DNA_START=67 /DNA_END=246 /DNA_ORIENTATION=-
MGSERTICRSPAANRGLILFSSSMAKNFLSEDDWRSPSSTMVVQKDWRSLLASSRSAISA